MAESLTLADIERELGELTDAEARWLIGSMQVLAPEAVANALALLAEKRGAVAEREPQAAVFPASTSGILREAARVMRTHAPTVMDIAATIRLAAGADPAGRARAEETLAFAHDHVEPGIHITDLGHWRRRRTCLQVAESLEMAATAAEQGGAS
ncbi:hypothetical protein [Streptosporangium sp. NPDC002721]|uniref:hypothetical protein n=1 Tax=Streptosporangium sp. NPDC002721 TaxID=3366188 RepID=UPI0036B9DDFB